MGDRAYAGIADPEDATSEHNRLSYLIRSLIGRMATTTIVRIVAVESAGELAPVGFVDVNPLVAMIDGGGKATPHGTIHRVPYMRLQGGINAVIIDPVVGDIGIAVFASGDISAVKNNKGPSNPGSRRRNSFADALYIGGVLNGVPQQYIRFSSDGIEVKGAAIKLIGPVTIQGTLSTTDDVSITGKLTATTDVLAGIVSLKSHKHTGVTPGTGVSGPPFGPASPGRADFSRSDRSGLVAAIGA
jgi:hypothetical protein